MKLPPARMTIGIVAITACAWLLIWLGGLGDVIAWSAGFVPGRVGHPEADAAMIAFAHGAGHPNFILLPWWATIVTSPLVHVGFLDMLVNLLLIAYCGRFVEIGLGDKGFVAIYVCGALANVAAIYLLNPGELSPVIGASGAGSAIIAAYALLYGTPRPISANRRMNRFLNVAWLAATWVILQCLMNLANGGAIVATVVGHIAGFAIGLILARPLLLFRYRHA